MGKVTVISMSGTKKSSTYILVLVAAIVLVWRLRRSYHHHDHRVRGMAEASLRNKRTEDSGMKDNLDVNSREIISEVCTTAQRTSHLHSTCQQHRRDFLNTKVAFGKQFIVDDQQKVVYCQVPNIGSHSIKSALIKAKLDRLKRHAIDSKRPMLGNWEHGLEDYGLTHMTKIMPMYKNYSKFLIVRHPMDRILSAFHHVKSTYKHQKSVVQYFRQRFSLGSMHNLTLQQFTEVITDSNNSPPAIYNNIRWRSIAEICFPCHIKYNSILRLETLNKDSEYFHKLKISPADVPHLNQNPNAQKSIQYGVKHLLQFSNLPIETTRKLQQRYQMDMDLFGYNYDDIAQISSCSISLKANGMTCC